MNSLTREAVPQVVHPAGLRGAAGVLAHRHFSPFKVFIAREHRIAVILNPKVGTTSFRTVVQRAYREVIGRRDVSNGRYKLFRKAREFPFSPICDYLHAFSRPQEYDFYCFVRNPYARLKSAWNDKLAWGHEDEYPPSIRGPILNDIRAFAGEQALPGYEPGSAIPFATFVAYVGSGKRGKQNHHWDEQFSVLLMDRIRYAQVFKMETQFVEGTKRIFARIGVPEAWTEEALSIPCNESRKADVRVFTPELADMVQNIFARDFLTLGYEVDSWVGT